MNAEHEDWTRAQAEAQKASAAVPIATRRKYRLTDLGNAERFAAMFQDRVRFCHQWRKWLVRVEGGWWQVDDAGGVGQLAKQCVREIYEQASRCNDEAERVALASHAAKSEARSRVEGLIALAESERGIPVQPAHLDADPFVFGCANGVVDLRTGVLRPYEPSDLVTKVSPVAYDPGADAPQWLAFLARVLPDEDVRTFVQRWFGYSMLGVVRHHLLPIWYGSGANGKSTALEAVKFVFGPYAMTAAPTLLLDKGGETHPTDVADLFGRRLVVTSEVQVGKPFDEEQIKRLTGGDTIRARRMREDFWEFTPSHKIVLAANHKPRVRDTTESIWRRLRVVPWTVVVPEAERDECLPERLREEGSGILRWCVDGCVAYQSDGLREPDAVKVATAEYRQESDRVAEFVTDKCERRHNARTPAKRVFEAYEKWCEDNGEKPMTQKAFGSALTEKGFERGKIGGVKVYPDLAIMGQGQATL